MRLSLFLLISLSSYCYAQTLTGKVVAIADGDTFTLLTSASRQVRVRLYGIDCPEKTQDFGTVARQFLSTLIFSKQVTVTQKGKDRYGRVIGITKIGKVNSPLVWRGTIHPTTIIPHGPI